MANCPIVFIGMGGHAQVLLEAIHHTYPCILGYVNLAPVNSATLSLQYLGNDEHFLSNSSPRNIILINGIGGSDVNKKRESIFQRYIQDGYKFKTIIHPSVVISKNTTLGKGCQIMAGAVIQPNVQCGDNVIINTSASIDHDCIIGSHSHISVGVTLSGNVQIGKNTHLGAGCTVIQGIQIGSNSLIAAGAVVVSHVPDNKRMAGVPARELNK